MRCNNLVPINNAEPNLLGAALAKLRLESTSFMVVQISPYFSKKLTIDFLEWE